MNAGALIFRFLVGGIVVSLFSLIGQAFKPKTFAGLFGAAPSVAIATLALTYSEHGSSYIVTEARSMMVGALAFTMYGLACIFFIRKERMPVMLSAVLAWVVWLGVAFLGVAILRAVDVS